MNTHRLQSDRLVRAILSGVAVALLGITNVSAKDTDIYLKTPQVSRDDSPDILILLDNSGSMESNSITTTPSYDATTTYSGSYDATRVYWATSGIPSSGTSNWFPATNNKCTDSLVNLGNTAGATGYYSGITIVGWKWKTTGSGSSTSTSSTQGQWANLAGGYNADGNAKMADVECERDQPADSGAGNTYLTSSNSSSLNYSNRYTSNSSNGIVWTAFNKPTLYSGNYLNYKANPPASTTKTRMQIAREAVKTIIDSNKGVRFGLEVFNRNNTTPDGGRILMRIDTMTDDRRAAMKSIVDSITGYADSPTNSQQNFTPLAESLWEAYRYFSGGQVDYGNPSPNQVPEQDSCAQKSSGTTTSDFYCDKGGVYRAISGSYTADGTWQTATVDTTNNDGTYETPFRYGCQKAYIIIVTDGGPTNDGNADSNIHNLIGSSSCAFNSSDPKTDCLKDLAGWIHGHDVSSLAGDQKVTTYAVGFGTGIGADEQYLLDTTAANGGTGQAYLANSSEELGAALQNAVTNAAQTNSSFSSPSLSVNAFNRLYNRDEVYFALFKPSTQQGWDGNIKKFTLCNSTDVTTYGCTYGEVIDKNHRPAIDSQSRIITDTSSGVAVSYWGNTVDGADVTSGGAGAQISQNSAIPRTLYTYLGSYTGLTSSTPATPTAIVATSTNSVYTAAINDPTILGLTDTSGSATTTNTADTTAVTNLINWMRGQDAFDRDNDGNTTESRSWNFGDPLHSRPVAITYGAVTNVLGVVDYTQPIVKLFVGTNDGMVRMINNSTGAEEWAFMPKELLKNQSDLSQRQDAEHIIGMDDTPSFWVNDVNNDGIIDPTAGDFVYMYIGMRRGVDPTTGHGFIYAFDATPSSKMTSQSNTVTPKLMWVIEGGTGNFTHLGQTWSRPKFVRIRTKCNGTSCNTGDSATKPVLIFGGGYDTNQDTAVAPGADSTGNAIYIVDPYTGARIWWASSDTTATLVLNKMNYSIPSELTLTDSNADGWIDRIYVGDTGGQLWRIDLGDQLDTNANGGSAGYVFADVGCGSSGTTVRVHDTSGGCPTGTTNQDRRKFFYPPDVAQVDDPNFSTTAKYDLVTIASGDREDPIDLLTNNLSPTQEPVHNRLYAFRDYNYAFGPPATTPTTITDIDLYDATANNLGTMTGSTLQTEIDTNVKGSKGWYINLQETSAITLPNGLTTTWVGEKGLAKTVIFGGVLYATTYVPANSITSVQTCSAAEGEGKVYAVNYLSGTQMFDLNHSGDGVLDRSAAVGGGIPSEPVIVIREGGVSGLVGTSGGAASIDTNSGNNKYRTYWYDE
ncbi:MAG: pilus assembly protein [Bacteroidota bacterium]